MTCLFPRRLTYSKIKSDGFTVFRDSSFILYPPSMNKEFHQSVWNEELKQDWLRILALGRTRGPKFPGRLHDRGLGAGAGPGQSGHRRSPIWCAGRRGGDLRHFGQVSARVAQAFWLRPGSEVVVAGPRWASFGGTPIDRNPGRPCPGDVGPGTAALNMLGRLSGIASLTRRYVDAVSGTRAGIYDTRKTTPGWRSLEKYAVRCGGGRNHRAAFLKPC